MEYNKSVTTNRQVAFCSATELQKGEKTTMYYEEINYTEKNEEENSTSRDGRSDFYPFNQEWLDEYYASKGLC